MGARTADTIRYGIIPLEGFRGNAGVQLLAFACAAAGAATWVMWCTRHSAHVSSTYSLVSSIAGVGVAAVGAANVEWGWNDGQGLGAIFGGLCIAPMMSAIFAATIFMLIKTIVHMRSDPVPWAVYTSPFFFFIAGTVCTLSIVFRGSPRLGLDERPGWFIAAVSLGTGAGVALLSAIFFLPYVHAKVIKKDYKLKVYDIWQGPLLFKRPPPPDASSARVPNYAVLQHGGDFTGGVEAPTGTTGVSDEVKRADDDSDEKAAPGAITKGPTDSAAAEVHQAGENPQQQYQRLLRQAREQHHVELRAKKGPLGWAMRTIYNNPPGAGSVYEIHNLKAMCVRLPAMVVVAALYGLHYDIHRAQVGVLGTPEGRRMDRVYAHASKYQNEVEYLYSFVQILTACTASFAHGANDVGNAVGVWAAMYTAWRSASATEEENEVPLWQIAVIALTICFGFITYGYNIMKGKQYTYIHPQTPTRNPR